jgi:hypothetical protein
MLAIPAHIVRQVLSIRCGDYPLVGVFAEQICWQEPTHQLRFAVPGWHHNQQVRRIWVCVPLLQFRSDNPMKPCLLEHIARFNLREHRRTEAQQPPTCLPASYLLLNLLDLKPLFFGLNLGD